MKCLPCVLLMVSFVQMFLAQPTPVSNVKKDAPSTSTLQRDLNDFLTLMPVDEIKRLSYYYYQHDEEVRAAYDYLNGQEFQIIKRHIMNLKEMKGFLRTMSEADINVMELVDRLGGILQPPTSLEADASSEVGLNITTTGMDGYIDDLVTSLPRDEFVTMFFEKLEFSEDFSIFCSKLEMGEFTAALKSLEASNDIQILLSKLKQHNIDLQKLVGVIKNFIGFGF